jgi:hypothetical protein
LRRANADSKSATDLPRAASFSELASLLPALQPAFKRDLRLSRGATREKSLDAYVLLQVRPKAVS